MPLPFQEPFTGGAAVLPNPPWTQAALGAATLNLDGSGRGKASAADAIDVIGYDNSNVYNNNQYGRLTAVGGLQSATNYAEVLICCSGTGATFQAYQLIADGDVASPGHTDLLKWVAGASAVLTSFAVAWTGGDVMQIDKVGTLITCYKNGVSIGTFNDTSSPLSGGAPGCGIYNGVSDTVVIDTFEGGNTAGGATVRPQPIRYPTIADRMARTLILAGALTTHVYVGRHMLRGAPARTKVALPVVKQTRITPPPVRVVVLAHVLKGAPKRKPWPLPEIVLVRKPAPVTRTITLPHVLKGAALRKPWPFPEVGATRTPPPSTRPYVGKHVFPVAVVAPRVIIDPTVLLARTPAPKVQNVIGRFVARVRSIVDPVVVTVRTPPPIARSVVARAVIQHPVSGSGGPLTIMIEMDAPVMRSVIGRRTTLPPIPPAPSRARPILVFTRTPKPATDTTVGEPLPRLPIVGRSFARPTTVFVRTPRPVTDVTVGLPLPHAPIAARSLARPIVRLVKTLKPVTDVFVGFARAIAAPVRSRARPFLARVRIPLARTRVYAGSGIARGPAIAMTLAIAQSNGTVSLSSPIVTVALRTEQNITVPLTTSE